MEPLSDEFLLGQFVTSRDEAAFGTLVRRHGPLVFAVCRRLLRHEQDAEDAFQATFLVLARRAGSITKRAALRSWLYGVAIRIARRVGAARGKRRAREVPLDDAPAKAETPEWARWELGAALDEEITRLPARYRQPVVLCYLGGLTYEQAAAELRVPVGTVRSRLARARQRLYDRLSRRGVALASGLLAAALAETAASGTVPTALLEATAQAAVLFQGGATAAAPAKAVALATAYLRARFLERMKVAMGLLAALLLLVTGLFWLTGDRKGAAHQAASPAAPPKSDREQLQGNWLMTSASFGGQGPNDGGGANMTFAGNRCAFTLGNGRVLPMTFAIDPSKTPKTIDFTYALEPAGVIPGIYEIDGDDLRLCYDNAGRERPATFASPAGSTFALLVLRRNAGPK